MNDQAIRLESLRQEAQTFDLMAGNLYDYLDHGHPDEQQRRQALAEIADYEREEQERRRQLHEALVALRAAAPQVVREWVGWHMDICQHIIAEGKETPSDQDGNVTDQAVRLHVAQQTLAEWKKVLSGEQDFVSINAYYLRDYYEQVSAAVEKGQPRS